jgi:serine/threonine-protein kinase
MAAAVILFALAGGWFLGRGRNASGGERTVVVLPFANLGAPEDAYFADGVSDEIASQIARIPGMMVVARNSAQRFKGSDRAPQDIAKELGAAYVLSGSVRWARTAGASVDAGAEVRIVPALLRTSTGEQLWGEPFQEKLTDVFRVQSDVAERVALALSVKLGKSRQTVLQSSESRDPAAVDAQLLGHSLLRQRGLENLRQAAVYFGRAIARDSSYARAWAGYSLAYSYLPVYFDTTISVEKADAEAERAARRAIALDSMLPDAHMALTQVLFHRVRLREALASADRALALDPSSAMAHKDRAEILLTQGRVEEAAVSMRRALALDPLVPVIQADMAVTWMALRQPDSALATIQRLIAFDPSNAYWHWTGAMIFAVKGMADSSVASCLRFTPDEHFCRTLQLATADQANRNQVLAYLGALTEHPDVRINSALQALYYAREGEADSAFARLRIAMQHGEQEFYGPINSPWFDPLKHDPRWDQIVGTAQRQ